MMVLLSPPVGSTYTPLRPRDRIEAFAHHLHQDRFLERGATLLQDACDQARLSFADPAVQLADLCSIN